MDQRRHPRTARNPHPDAELIRRQVLLALAGIRSGGFHFPGYFLNIDWPEIGDDHVTGTLAEGPHCADADGRLNLAAFGVLLDTSVAVTSRLRLPAGDHQATVQLHAQFTGQPLRGILTSTARHDGHTSGAGVRQAIVSATVRADGAVACHATSAFINYPAPPGVSHGPPVKDRKRVTEIEPLTAGELDAAERAVFATCNRALRRADTRHAFIEHFWNITPRTVPGGARCSIGLASHFGNRTGDVQGGVLFGIAAATARLAAPRHPHLSNISAWFVGPGRGGRLVARSRLIQAGRSFATVRTEIVRPGGARVLETVSQHTT